MRISSASAIGGRTAQEDRYLIHNTEDGTLLAVMDGHGGDTVAEICKDYLPAFWDLSVLTKDYGVQRSYDKALAVLIWQLDSITKEYSCGSTISLAFVPKTTIPHIYLATLGDSPVVVRLPSGVCHVSESHNVRTNLDERRAAELRGGSYRQGYIWNGMGDFSEGLQMARALGDGTMGPVVSKDPDIEMCSLGDFVLLATDGAFDAGHENELQAIADVVALIDEGGEAQAIVDRTAHERNSDNVTAVLLKR